MNRKIVNALEILKDAFKGDNEAIHALRTLEGLATLKDAPDKIVDEFPLTKEFLKLKKGIAIYSDGACRGNPGPGSYGVMGQNSKGELLFTEAKIKNPTTNNQMELMGALVGMEWALKDDLFDTAIVYSDSKYFVNGMNSWVSGWKRKGWKKADKKPIINLEIWQKLDQAREKFKDISFVWVKGHSGHPQNEYCDQLANKALDQAGH